MTRRAQQREDESPYRRTAAVPMVVVYEVEAGTNCPVILYAIHSNEFRRLVAERPELALATWTQCRPSPTQVWCALERPQIVVLDRDGLEVEGHH